MSILIWYRRRHEVTRVRQAPSMPSANRISRWSMCERCWLQPLPSRGGGKACCCQPPTKIGSV